MGNAPFLADAYFGHRTRLYNLDLLRNPNNVSKIIEKSYECGVRSINLANKENPDKITYLDERLRPILEMTYGCIVYQEQVMQIVQKVGGYSLGRADMLRRIMSKKKQKEMEKQKNGRSLVKQMSMLRSMSLKCPKRILQ